MANRFVLYVIRHLPTAGNKQRKYIGWTDEPILKPTELFGYQTPTQFNPQHVHGSDLLRARQSAAVYFPEAMFIADHRWRECNFGEFEGKTYEDLEKDRDYRQWIDDPNINRPPGGENLGELKTRVLSVLKEMPSDGVIVTHGGPIRIILTTFSPEKKELWSWNVPHGAGYRLEWESEKTFEEGKACTSISAVPITANEIM